MKSNFNRSCIDHLVEDGSIDFDAAEQVLIAYLGLPSGQRPPVLVDECAMSAVSGVKKSNIRYRRWTKDPNRLPEIKDGRNVRYNWRQCLRFLAEKQQAAE